MPSLLPHGMHTLYTHSEWWHTHTRRWDDGGRCSLLFSHPGILPQGHPGAVGGQQCGTRGPTSICSFCMFLLLGFYGGTRGEHANSTQKGPGISPDMLHNAGLEPTTFLLWGNSATVPPCPQLANQWSEYNIVSHCTYNLKKKGRVMGQSRVGDVH